MFDDIIVSERFLRHKTKLQIKVHFHPIFPYVGAGADYRFLLGGKIFQVGREAFKILFLPPSVWGQSYNRGGQTYVSFIHHDLVIRVVLTLPFFENSESQ